MASSRKLTSSDLGTRVLARLSRVAPYGARLRLGLSGGQDSVALFYILADLAPQRGYAIECMHVHHGISPRADEWSDFCAQLCAARNIKLDIIRVELEQVSVKGLEGSARIARYGALSRKGADFVVLAHHLQDQAETILLQLVRGSGAKGLSAMPETRASNGVRIIRPMLNEPFSEIQGYVGSRRLAWVTDESNDDTRFSRNFVRHEILPMLEARFRGTTAALARSAGHMAEAQKLLEELAALDLAGMKRDGGLSITCLQVLDDIRAKNVLRFYFAHHGLDLPQSVHLGELLRQIKSIRPDSKITFNLGKMIARCHKGVLLLEAAMATSGSGFERNWTGESVWNLPEFGGVLSFFPALGEGVSAAKLSLVPVTVRLRRGGERMQMDSLRPRRTLKNLFQEAGIPPWRRRRLPLIYVGEDLAFVPGFGVALEFRAGPEEAGVLLEWSESAAVLEPNAAL